MRGLPRRHEHLSRHHRAVAVGTAPPQRHHRLHLAGHAPLFANARSVKNALDRARMRQANRIFDSRGQILTKKELVNLEAADILQSSVFND